MLYEAFVKREAAQELRDRRMSMINAYLANSAYLKSTEGPKIRQEIIENVISDTEDQISVIYGAKSRDAIDAEMRRNDPFLAAIDTQWMDAIIARKKEEEVDG